MIFSNTSIPDPGWNDETRNALVSNKNVLLYYFYLKDYPLNNETDICKALFSDKAEKDFFTDKDNWCTLEDYVRIVERACELTGNFELPKLVGLMLTRFQKEYKLQEFSKVLANNLRAIIWGPVEIFKQISFFNGLFNQTKEMEFISGQNGECIIKTKFKPGVNPVYDYVSEGHIEGILKSVIDLFNLENAHIDSLLKEYDLRTLIEQKFHSLNKKCVVLGENFYLGKTLIARKVSLAVDIIRNKEIYLGKISTYTENSEIWGWQIVKDVYLDSKYLILEKGEIYNAPYFITKINWDKIVHFKSLLSLSLSQFRTISPLGSGYAKLARQRMAEEHEKTRAIIERRKLEKEVNSLLIRNYIHQKFIEKAKIGPIPFKTISVTNLFIDLHNSTEKRKRLGNEIYRHDMNILLGLIKKCLTDISKEWGWLNKVMGDGCYVVFGAYNYFKAEQDLTHVEQALNFISCLLSEIESAKKLALERSNHVFFDIDLRFGVEMGEVELGEAHENDLSDIFEELDLGSLRVFDTDGHSVHLAKRIEEVSKQIINIENRGKKGGIFLGPAILELVARHPKHNNKLNIINLRKKNLYVKDFEEITHIGEIII